MSMRIGKRGITYYASLSIALLTSAMLSGLLLEAQNAPPGATKAAPAVKSTKGTKSTAKGGGKAKQDIKKAPAQPRGPLTRQNVEDLWKNPNPELLLNEIRLRGLAFEPEEDWLASMAKLNPLPAVISELKTHVAPAPQVDAVQAQGAQLLSDLKTAVQARNEEAMAALVHPELMAQKSKLLALFDPGNYRNHVLGRYSAVEYRRVGVQFFQLTTSQVEKLDYVLFANSKGKIVVRDVESGPRVAERYLKDEAEFAKSKLELVFRAMNDGDEGAMQNLCTPGLFDSIKRLSGGARLTRGVRLTAAQLGGGGPISLLLSVSMESKSIRPVARMAFNAPTGRRIEFDVDFERVNNDLKVVRVRDKQNKVIAWDPDFDNYLNRRFNFPDGPRVTDPPQGWTDLVEFQPLDTIREFAMTAIRTGNSKLIREYAQEIREALPNSGEGYGLMASADHLLGKFTEAQANARRAMENGGTVYMLALQYRQGTGQQFWPVVVAVSPATIRYMSVQGVPPGDIAPAAIRKINLDSGGKFTRLGAKSKPFLVIESEQNGKKRTEHLAAGGTTCQATPEAAVKANLFQWTGGSVCLQTAPKQQQQQQQQGGVAGAIGGVFSGTTVSPLYVPNSWMDNLLTIQSVIEAAQRGKMASN